MESGLTTPALPIALLPLVMGIGAALVKKGVFTTQEWVDIIDHAILNLEQQQALQPADSAPFFPDARALLERMRELSSQRAGPGA